MNKLYFRAWLPKTKEMSKVDSINFRGDNNKKPYVSLRSNNISVAYFDEVILMQGIEVDDQVVYVGDMIESTFINGDNYIFEIEDLYHLFQERRIIEDYDLKFKVIGNIYEKDEEV